MKWIIKEAPEYSISLEIPEIIKDILAKRGITTDEQVKEFFTNKNFKFPDPLLLPNMNKAIERIRKAKKNNEKVVIYGDYDVDGVTAVSILYDFLRNKLEIDTYFYIPSRFDEGYGLNENALKKLSKQYDLLITVDCGVRDKELISKFQQDIDFIITDHHTLPEDSVTFDYPVIHPSLLDSKYPFKHLSGAGVVWKLIWALQKAFRITLEQDEYLEFVALSTVCDIMPITNENRHIVKIGLNRLKKGKNIGLNELIKVSGVNLQDIKSYHLGFVLGPRINAAGRLEKAEDAVNLFISNDKEDARKLASKLNNLNLKRQEILAQLLDEAKTQIDESKKFIFVYGKNWHEGVVGLIAGRLTEEFNKPSICASVNEDGKVVASARSVTSFNITEAISNYSDLLIRFGGHKSAAGLSCSFENLEKFKSKLENYAEKFFAKKDLESKKDIDYEIEIDQINLRLLKWIELFEPFGFKNPNIVFLIKNMQILNIVNMGNQGEHIKFSAKQKHSKILDLIKFSATKKFKKIKIGDKIDAIGTIKKNIWKDNVTIQFNLLDIRLIEN